MYIRKLSKYMRTSFWCHNAVGSSLRAHPILIECCHGDCVHGEIGQSLENVGTGDRCLGCKEGGGERGRRGRGDKDLIAIKRVQT